MVCSALDECLGFSCSLFCFSPSSFPNSSRMSHYRLVFFCHLFLAFHVAVTLPLHTTHTHTHSCSFPLMKSICKCTTRNEGSLSTHQWSLISTWNEWQRNQRRLTFIVLKWYSQKKKKIPFLMHVSVNQITDRNPLQTWNVKKISPRKLIVIPERHVWL